MAPSTVTRSVPPQRGFSLVELTIVVILVGALAVFAVPRVLQSVERSTAAESFQYLASVRAAQERYHARNGIYASDLNKLDMSLAAPTTFSIGVMTAGITGSLNDSWKLTLTRKGRNNYGPYTVTYTQEGYDPSGSTIAAEIDPQDI